MSRFPASLRLALGLTSVAALAVVGPGATSGGGESFRSEANPRASTSPTGEDRGSGPDLQDGSSFFGAPLSRGELPEFLDRLPAPATSPSGSASRSRAPAPGLATRAPESDLPAVSASDTRVPALPVQVPSDRPDRYYDFYFTRAVYGSGGLGRRGFFGESWSVDFPKADRQFLVVLGETLDLLRVPSRENPVRLEDPDLRRYPFLYTLEVGRMRLTQPQVEGLRSYLRAGGFLVVDDFWGDWEWRNFEAQMRRVFPEVEFEEIPLDHEIFHVFYDIEEILQVPNVNNAAAGVTSECGPCQPHVRGIFDDEGRLMVVINWNTDLGDAWEWSERAVYPFQYSNFAYKMAVNFIVYAMTH